MFRICMLPAEDGDCLLVETGSDAAPHRILIDGGRRSCFPAITELLGKLEPARSPLIDLLVLTHIDADHIEGLLAYIAELSTPGVVQVWFNGYAHHRIAAGKPGTLTWPPPPPVPEAKTPVLSAGQALQFARAIHGRGWLWNADFKGGPAMIPDDGELPAFELSHGGRIVLLGPSRKRLKALVNEWESAFDAMFKQNEATLSSEATLSGKPEPVPGSLEVIAKQRDQPDKSKPNGGSIAFVLEYDGKRALFAADALPADIIEGLIRYQNIGNRVSFDAVKVAHHGSTFNNTSAVIDRLASPLWLVSTDGSRNKHPDCEAIARIILSENSNKKIIFNYQTKINEIWNKIDLKNHYNYCVEFKLSEFVFV